MAITPGAAVRRASRESIARSANDALGTGASTPLIGGAVATEDNSRRADALRTVELQGPDRCTSSPAAGSSRPLWFARMALIQLSEALRFRSGIVECPTFQALDHDTDTPERNSQAPNSRQVMDGEERRILMSNGKRIAEVNQRYDISCLGSLAPSDMRPALPKSRQSLRRCESTTRAPSRGGGRRFARPIALHPANQRASRCCGASEARAGMVRAARRGGPLLLLR